MGGVYFADVSITSSAKVSCRLKSLAPSRSEFSVTPLQFPMNDAGQLAPGMACHCKVIFAPVHLAEVEDSFAVATQLGIIHIKLRGKRPSPQLMFPKLVDLGPCLVGSEVSCTVPIENTGGTGRFTVMALKDCLAQGELPEDMVSHHRWLESPEDEWPPPVSLTTTAFKIDRVGFRLAQKESHELKVTFSPEKHGVHNDECYILCDDCSYTPLHFTGLGSAPTITVTKIDSVRFDNQPVPRELLFGELTVSCSSSKKVEISNTAGMDVSFRWLLFVAQDVQPDRSELSGISYKPIAPPLQPLETDVFRAVPEQSNLLKAGDSTEIEFIYAPKLRGSDAVVARLVITEPLSDMEQTVAEFTLRGEAKLCRVELSPPVVFFSGTLLMGKEYTRSFTLTNHGDAATSFNWHDPPNSDEGTNVSIVPANGTIQAKETLQLSLSLRSMGPRPSLQISHECSFEHAEPVVLFGEASVKAPEIHIEEASIDYGLVALQHRVSYNITMTNSTETPAQWMLCEQGGLDDMNTSVREFFFVPSHGCIAPMSSDVVTVCFKPASLGKYERTIELHSEDEHTQYLRVNAMVQAPKVSLAVSSLDLGTTYLGVKDPRKVTVKNLSMLPTHISWQTVEAEGMDIAFEPADVILKPAQELEVTVTFEPSVSGALSCLLACIVEGTSSPLGLAIETKVATLEIEYGILEAPQMAKKEWDHTKHIYHFDDIEINFGKDVPIFSAPTRTLLITNKSAIPANYELTVAKLEATSPVDEPVTAISQSSPSVGTPGALKRSFGRADTTVRLGDALTAAISNQGVTATVHTDRSARSAHSIQSTSSAGIPGHGMSHEAAPFRSEHGRSLVAARIRHAQEQSALNRDHGVAVALSQSTGVVNAWETVSILLTCYSNMAGHYTDQVRCQVADLPPALFPLSAIIKGSPVQFDPTCVGLRLPPNCAWGNFQFEPNLVNGPPVTKTVSLLNSGPLDLETNFKIVSEPRKFSSCDVNFSFDEDGRAKADVVPHVLNLGESPFTVSPSVVTIPAKSKADFKITCVTGGTASTVTQCLIVDSKPKDTHPHAELEREMLPALYLNLQADVIQAELTPVPKAQLMFHCFSSDSRNHASRTRIVHLTNNTRSIFSFGLDTIGPFEITKVQYEEAQNQSFPGGDQSPAASPSKLKKKTQLLNTTYNLKPLESVLVSVHFTESAQEDGPRDSDCHTFNGQLVTTFENGHTQMYQLCGDITYPAATLTTFPERMGKIEINFGIVRVGSHATSSVSLTACTPSSSQWTLTSKGARRGSPPRRGSISVARRSSISGVDMGSAPATERTGQDEPFDFKTKTGFFSVVAELRVWKQGGEVVTRRQRLDVGGWLSGLGTTETVDFYEKAAAKALVPPNPWGNQIMDWIQYNRDCPAEDKQRINDATQGTDTFSFVFPGDDFAHWYKLRKNVIRAGFLEGRPLHLKQDNSQAIIDVEFSPHGHHLTHCSLLSITHYCYSVR